MSPTRLQNARVMGSCVPKAEVFQFSLVSRRMSSAHSRNVREHIGQGDSVRDRIQSHLKNKEFWREAVVFYRQPDELHAGNIKYLESRLIQLAIAAGNCVLENAVSPQTPALAVAEKESTEDFLKHAIFSLGAIGYDFFTPEPVLPPNQAGAGGDCDRSLHSPELTEPDRSDSGNHRTFT
jgi:hypothetical protein